MNECEIGLFVKCPQPEMIEAMGISGLDFAVVDMEHTPLGPRDLYPLVLAAERRNFSIIVRIPHKMDAYFKWCRDLNVTRIQVPHVETVDDILFAVKHTYFSPVGQRGLCRFVRAADFSGKTKDEYLEYANGSNELILQIEGDSAIANIPSMIEAIKKLPTPASLFIGPYDLSQSLGLPGQIWDDKVVKKMEDIVHLCQDSHIKVGTFTDSEDGVAFWKNRGISYIQYASDLNLFLGAARHLKSLIS